MSPWPEHEVNAAGVRSLRASGMLDWHRLGLRPLLAAGGVDRITVTGTGR